MTESIHNSFITSTMVKCSFSFGFSFFLYTPSPALTGPVVESTKNHIDSPFQGENTSKHQMLFNMSEMRSVLGTDRLLSQAELRLLIKNRGKIEDNEQRLELYRGVGDKARYLKSHFVSKEWANRWVSFDVTQTLNEWLQGAGKLQFPLGL